MMAKLNAMIEGARIVIDCDFILSAYIDLKYETGWHQSFGGYVLGGTAGKAGDHTSPNLAAEFIAKAMKCAGVDDWSKMAGRALRVEVDKEGLGQNIIAIGHIIDDYWLSPKSDFGRLLGEAQ